MGDLTNHIKNITYTQLSHNLMKNECPYKTSKDKKKVRMIRVAILFYTDPQGNETDSVSMECCVEHKSRAEESLIESNGLKR